MSESHSEQSRHRKEKSTEQQEEIKQNHKQDDKKTTLSQILAEQDTFLNHLSVFALQNFLDKEYPLVYGSFFDQRHSVVRAESNISTGNPSARKTTVQSIPLPEFKLKNEEIIALKNGYHDHKLFVKNGIIISDFRFHFLADVSDKKICLGRLSFQAVDSDTPQARLVASSPAPSGPLSPSLTGTMPNSPSLTNLNLGSSTNSLTSSSSTSPSSSSSSSPTIHVYAALCFGLQHGLIAIGKYPPKFKQERKQTTLIEHVLAEMDLMRTEWHF